MGTELGLPFLRSGSGSEGGPSVVLLAEVHGMAGTWILLAVRHCFLGLGLCMGSLGQQGNCCLSWESRVWGIVHMIIRAPEVGGCSPVAF